MLARSIALGLALLASAPAFAAEPTVPDRAHAAAEQIRANEALIRELAAMSAIDTLIRDRFLALRHDATPGDREALDAIWTLDYEPFDRANVARLKVLLKDRHWFRRSEVGRRVADSAFHIVQHSGDLALMKRVAADMEPMTAQGEADPQGYAMLYDRIAFMEKRPQRYGTQGTDCANGRYAVPRDLEDPAGLDARRAKMNLQPMGEYLAGLDKMYGACTPPPSR